MLLPLLPVLLVLHKLLVVRVVLVLLLPLVELSLPLRVKRVELSLLPLDIRQCLCLLSALLRWRCLRLRRCHHLALHVSLLHLLMLLLLLLLRLLLVLLLMLLVLLLMRLVLMLLVLMLLLLVLMLLLLFLPLLALLPLGSCLLKLSQPGSLLRVTHIGHGRLISPIIGRWRRQWLI